MGRAEDLAELYERIHVCRACPRTAPSLRAREIVPQACEARLALMAQAPSEGGVRKSGIHWVGADRKVRRPGGTFLDKYLKTVGYSVDPADARHPRPYTTNVLHCWTGRSGKRDRRPSTEELRRCKHWWVAELGIVRPTALVLLGKPAAEAFAAVCDAPAAFAAMLDQQGEVLTLGDLSVHRFVLPQPTAPYPGRSGLYADVFRRIGELLGV